MQEELSREMEALKAEENLDIAGRRMRELQGRWKQVALAPRAQGEAMWRRFKTAQDEVFARTSAHLAAQNEERSANLARKQALCERAEALADSTDWVKTATEIQALQAEWKTIGPVTRGHEKAVWERFRAACDRFFTRRQEDLKHRKEEWSVNLARKEASARGRGAVELHRLGRGGGADQAAAGRVEDDRPGAQVEVGGGVAALPRRVRSLLRSLQAPRPARAAGEGRPRESVIRELEALLPPTAPPTRPGARGPGDGPSRTRARAWQQAPGAAARDAAGPGRPVPPGAVGRIVAAGRRRLPAPSSIPRPRASGWRSCWRGSRSSCRRSRGAGAAADLSPAELLAQQWRERLAANTMGGGGRSVENDEIRWRDAEQEVRSAQSQWTRLGPVPADVAGPLNERFQRAVRKFYEHRRRAS